MKIKFLTKLCINLLMAVVIFTALYCVNFGVSWLNNLSYGNMLAVTLPFIGLSICCLFAFSIVADNIEEKRQREIRKRKRNFVLKKAYRNRNKIIYLNHVSKLDLFKEAC